ncbi:hypothetical protein [Sorangium sp. So ce861]
MPGELPAAGAVSSAHLALLRPATADVIDRVLEIRNEARPPPE